MTNEKNDFTKGSILKKLALFMLLILGRLGSRAAYGAVDLLVVGRFGSTSGLSAVSTGARDLNLVTLCSNTVCNGNYSSHCPLSWGKETEQIGSVIGGATVVFAVISAALFVIMVAFARPFLCLCRHHRRHLS